MIALHLLGKMHLIKALESEKKGRNNGLSLLKIITEKESNNRLIGLIFYFVDFWLILD